ncbi:non-ribosomal peptide synthetase [Actinomadura litoris]|uniref:Amino acid adenylation domain-containing protein n=1 Tax=Actinomadura litoris TaxID=2678616 RepID=A0A7K1L403_9ACTN|nr:non-ribosomal peptide synthetase [Actinomadura litoris]MUN39100.1 amino acid adenylation domain-containing protein [Actinomadura litoris]
MTQGSGSGAPERAHEIIEDRARRAPERTAVVAGAHRSSYAELERRAGALARALANRGIGRGDLVGICLERDEWLVPALLAVWKAGAAYVPLDAAYPAERLRLIGADAGFPVVLTSAALAATAAATGAEPMIVQDVPEGAEPPRVPGGGGDPAYVIYTSGSTGRPKGVVVEHRNTVNLLTWADGFYSREETAGHLAAASICFDASILEIAVPLAAGGTVILAENLLALPELPAREEVTAVHGVPSVLAAVLTRPLPPGVRVVGTGGEALTASLAARIWANPGVRRVVNTYGPTECTTLCTAYELRRDETGAPPIGFPVTGAVTSVRDGRGDPVPDGTPGELWVSGPCVARGYLNRPALTARSFTAGGYRTGDRVRSVDGVLHFLGRADDQVKIRGYRVEPGEVRHALTGHPAVRDAVVLARADRLVAYVEADPAIGADIGADIEDELRAHLARLLPEYMVPSGIGVLDRLPTGPTGEVDRDALPELGAARPSDPSGEAFRADAEREAAEVIADVLGLPEVGPHAVFADLGGHSLQAARVVSEMSRRRGYLVPLAAFLAAPTAAGLAAVGPSGAAPPVRHAGRTTVPLTDAQREFWTLRQLHPDRPVTTLLLRFWVRGLPDAAPLRDALDAVVRRHEVLRSTVVTGEDGIPVAVVHPPVPVPLTESPVEADAARAAHVFDLGSEVPLIRADLAWRGDTAAELTVAVDHIAFDGASVGILMDELAAELAGRAVPEPAVQVGDVAAAQAAETAPGAHRAFWRAELDGVPEPAPFGIDPSAARAGRPLPWEVEPAVAALARDCGATPFAVYLAALVLLSGEADPVIGAAAARRARPQLAGLIGPLVDALPVRARPGGAADFRALVRRAAAATARALAHQETPSAELPRVPVMLAVQHGEVPMEATGGGVRIELLSDPGAGAAAQELSWLVNRTVDGPEIQLEYSTARYDRDWAEAELDRFLRVLRAALADPGRPLAEYELVSLEEREALLAWAAGPGLPEFPATVPEALPRTGGTAVVGPDGASHDYADLHAEAARVAAALRARGAGRGALVGAVLPRDHRLPAALLGVWRAGAAYVLLDPDHPPERSHLLAEDAGARLMLVRGAAAFPGMETLDLDALPPVEGDPPEPEPPHADDLAYVLFTSGSTGRPKGVEITHGNLAAFVAGSIALMGLGPEEVMPAAAPVTFDIFAEELWLPLSAGGTCVLLDRADAVDGYALAARLRDCGATLVDLVPTTLRMLLEAGWEGDPRLQVISGGEALDPALAARLAPLVGRLWNGYGPSEATVGSTMHPVAPGAIAPTATTVPIGTPMAGERAYVTDPWLRLLPPGALGELVLGGAGVARGYRGRPDLTGAAFSADPHHPGGRRYRTGDLARWRPDGTLEFHGRRDHQVKVRGHRIELGEIEAVLHEVADGVVTAAGSGPEAHLVGHVAPADVDLDVVQKHLRARLPEHMVPRRWSALDALPRLPSGKADRSALPVPEARSAADRPAPGTDAEHLVADIWSAVLELPTVWADDDFLALGGHSFAATRVTGRIRETLGLAVPVRLLFDRPVLADFAAALEELLLAELAATDPKTTPGDAP